MATGPGLLYSSPGSAEGHPGCCHGAREATEPGLCLPTEDLLPAEGPPGCCHGPPPAFTWGRGCAQRRGNDRRPRRAATIPKAFARGGPGDGHRPRGPAAPQGPGLLGAADAVRTTQKGPGTGPATPKRLAEQCTAGPLSSSSLGQGHCQARPQGTSPPIGCPPWQSGAPF